ncbi:MAG TPA: hypothetical protein VKC66_38160 [Xanthobacteraceae bacterium]|nr:hypothetical protein [Xanthobacteraceae bacterium]
MTKLPARIITISGHLSHSLKLRFCFDISSAIADKEVTRVSARHRAGPSVAATTNNTMINAPRMVNPRYNSHLSPVSIIHTAAGLSFVVAGRQHLKLTRPHAS